MGCNTSVETATQTSIESKGQPQAEKPLVTITGVSGYIGSWVCLRFLEDGEFRVRGTVRSTKNEAKIAPLRKEFKSAFDELELVEADLNDETSIIKAIEGSTYVVHVASPVHLDLDDPSHIPTALAGTKSIMKACKRAGVIRCVVTSSIAAIMNVKSTERPKNNILNEAYWSDPNVGSNLFKSKILAEKLVWDYQKKLAEKNQKQFEIVTINPGFTMGPPLTSQ